MTKIDTCKGLCAKWDSITDEEAEGMVWCSKCFVHVKPERTHCTCCGKRRLGGLGVAIVQDCLHCGESFETNNLAVGFCSEECRTERKLEASRARAKAYYEQKKREKRK